MGFAVIDWVIVVAFFAVLLAIPALSNIRRTSSSSDFFRSGRSMPWWLIGISMVAAMTSTNSANLFTQLIREGGMAGNWVWWSFLPGGVLTVFVYARLWHRSGATTDIAFYELRYSGKPAAFLRGFRAVYLGVIYNVIVMATVLVGAMKLGAVLFGVPSWVILAVTAVASIGYSMIGGIRGAIFADFYLFAVIMVGAVAVMVFALDQPSVGGWSAMFANEAVRSKISLQPRFDDVDTLMAVLVVPLAIQWWNVWYSGSEPGGGGYIVQRMLTAKTPNHALGGTLFAQVVQYALRPWPWYIVAFASILVFPDLDSIRAAFPKVDPSLVGNDVWARFVRPGAEGRELVLVARWTSIVLMASGCALAPFIADAKTGFDLMVMIGAGTGAVFLLRWFWMRINAWSEIVAMAASFFCAVFFQLVWPRVSVTPLHFWHRLLLTIAVTTVAWLAATFATKPETEDAISAFKSLVRADGRYVGKGLLLTFLATVAIFAFMALIARMVYGLW